MKNIQLVELELSNYRNIEYSKLTFDGNSKIIGENRIGKTNTLEAVYWLLSDKLLDGSKDASAIKPLKDTKLEVRVKATFDVDGKLITLEKDYKEEWVKTRGTTNLELKGHTTTFIHNGVKQPTLKAYNQLVSEDFGFMQDATTKVEFMQMLINPFYIGNLGESDNWTELRAFIIKLVGDVKDSDVLASNPNFKLIQSDLELVGGRVDQLKKKYVGEIDGIKTDIIGVESTIKMLEETPNPTDEEVALAKKGIEEHQTRINSLRPDNTQYNFIVSDLEKKISEKRLELSNLEKEQLLKARNSDASTKISEELKVLNQQMDELLSKKRKTNAEMDYYETEIHNTKAKLDRQQNERKDLIDKIKLLDARIANPAVETECPHCHRPYDAEELEPAKHHLIEAANKEKEQLIEKGKSLRKVIDTDEAYKSECEQKLEEATVSLNHILADIHDLDKKISEKQTQYSELNATAPVVEDTPQIISVREKITELEGELKKVKEDFYKSGYETQSLIYAEEEAMKPFQKVLDDRKYYERQMESLASVRENLKELNVKLADCEQKKELLNMFNLAKLKMLDENVSKVFGKIKFQLIKENINGGYDPICKPYIYDTVNEESTKTTWRSGSKSERVATGIAICECIKSTLNLPNLPFLFDEGGEISSETLARRLKTDAQIICVKIADGIMTPLVQKL